MRITWRVTGEAWEAAIQTMFSQLARGALNGVEYTADVLWDAGPPAEIDFVSDSGKVSWGGPVLYLANELAVIPVHGSFDRVVIRGEPIWQSSDIVFTRIRDELVQIAVESVVDREETTCSQPDLVKAIEAFRMDLVTDLERRSPRVSRILSFRPLLVR
jgi:hypothetical protein